MSVCRLRRPVLFVCTMDEYVIWDLFLKLRLTSQRLSLLASIQNCRFRWAGLGLTFQPLRATYGSGFHGGWGKSCFAVRGVQSNMDGSAS